MVALVLLTVFGLAAAVPLLPNDDSSAKCTMCKLMAEELIKNSDSMMASATSICDAANAQTKSMCTFFVSFLGPKAAIMLKNTDAAGLCGSIGICGVEKPQFEVVATTVASFLEGSLQELSKSGLAQPLTVKDNKQSAACYGCQFGVFYLNRTVTGLVNNPPLHALLTEYFCPLFQAQSVVVSCQGVVTLGLDTFIAAIATGYTPELICQGACAQQPIPATTTPAAPAPTTSTA
jgi:hypothetical protein